MSWTEPVTVDGERPERVELEFATGETVCWTAFGSAQRYHRFHDAATGEQQWSFRGLVDPGDTPFAPPDDTTDHEHVSVSPAALADGTAYVTATYEDDAVLSAGLFAVDAADGSVEWSTTLSPYAAVGLDATGRLYAIDETDALFRAAPDDRERTDGEWTPAPGTDRRAHARAWNAATGDACWEWSRDLADDERFYYYGHASPAVAGGRVAVLLESVDGEPQDGQTTTPDVTTELIGLDVGTGEQTASMTLDRELWGSPVGIDGRVVIRGEAADTEATPLYGVDMNAETVDWTTSIDDGVIRAVTEEEVIVSGQYGDVTGIDPTSGDERWTTALMGLPYCVVGDTLVVVFDQQLRTHALSSPDVLAQTDLGGPIEDVVAADGRFYAAVTADDGARVVALE